MIWWSHIDYIRLNQELAGESLKVFLKRVNWFQPTIKLNAEYSKEEVNFLDIKMKLIDLKT